MFGLKREGAKITRAMAFIAAKGSYAAKPDRLAVIKYKKSHFN